MAKVRKTELDVDIVAEPEVESEPGGSEDNAPSEEALPAAAPKPSGGKKILILVTVPLILLVAIVFAVVMFLPDPVPEPEEEVVEEKQEEEFIPPTVKIPPEVNVKISTFAPFFLPLKNRKGDERFLRIKIAVSLSRAPLKREIEKNLIVLRTHIYDLLRKKKLEDMRSTEALKKLNGEIKGILNMAVQTGTITSVYFSELTIL